ncbi:uncharacterized protein LOC130861011 [Hippopotamus amphibius kiboko]|uniref:uncharacterized protein LOC130861011 n=1 Tax=Hippopotamus amphibius kiboko TaxID=575201 RepID=UPI002591A959|nr:uncharacterized protein LOC130861011 [Hippopotamus amphibius kiboko]
MSETVTLEDWEKIKGTEDRRAGADSRAGRGCGRHPGTGPGGGEAPSGWGRICAGPARRPGSRLGARRRAQAAAGGWWRPALSQASAGLFWPKVARAVPRRPPDAKESRDAVLPLTREKPRAPSKASQAGGWGSPGSRGPVRSVPGLRGGCWEPRPRMRHSRPCAAEAFSPARGWREGAARWTLARARSAVTRRGDPLGMKGDAAALPWGGGTQRRHFAGDGRTLHGDRW